MTTTTMSSARFGCSTLPAHLPAQRAPRPAPLRLVPSTESTEFAEFAEFAEFTASTDQVDTRPARVRSTRVAPSAVPSIQLTRRGRLVVLAVLLVAGIAMMIGLTGVFGSAAAGVTPTAPATHTIVVQPGQTLWSIAGQIAPGTDRRDTIARIVELNALPNSAVSAGERIAVPAH